MVQLVLSGCWFNCKSLDLSLLLLLHAGHCISFISLPLLDPWSAFSNLLKIVLNFLQTSGSLYGALVGSIVAFSIADVIGWFCFPLSSSGRQKYLALFAC